MTDTLDAQKYWIELFDSVEGSYYGWMDDLPWIYEDNAGDCVAENQEKLSQWTADQVARLTTALLASPFKELTKRVESAYADVTRAAALVDKHCTYGDFPIQLWMHGDEAAREKVFYPDGDLAAIRGQARYMVDINIAEGADPKKALANAAFWLAAQYAHRGERAGKAGYELMHFIPGPLACSDARRDAGHEVSAETALARAYSGREALGWSHIAEEIGEAKLTALEKFYDVLRETKDAIMHNLEPHQIEPQIEATLSVVMQNLLEAYLKLNAFDSDKRQTSAEVVRCAISPYADPNSYKKQIGKLVSLKLLASQEGRGGGAWLTIAGRERAERLKSP